MFLHKTFLVNILPGSFKNIGSVRKWVSKNVLGKIKNCGSWSDIVAVILTEIMSFEGYITENIVNKGSGMTSVSTELNNI